MKDFFMSWALGILLSTIVIGGIAFIGVFIWAFVTWLGIWAWMLVIPILFGLFMALYEL